MQRLLGDPCALAALVQAASSTYEAPERACGGGAGNPRARGLPGASPAEPPAPEAAHARVPAGDAAAAPVSACRQQSECRAELDDGEDAAEWGAQTGGRRSRRRAPLRARGRQRDGAPAVAACRAMLESYLLQARAPESAASEVQQPTRDRTQQNLCRIQPKSCCFVGVSIPYISPAVGPGPELTGMWQAAASSVVRSPGQDRLAS